MILRYKPFWTNISTFHCNFNSSHQTKTNRTHTNTHESHANQDRHEGLLSSYMIFDTFTLIHTVHPSHFRSHIFKIVYNNTCTCDDDDEKLVNQADIFGNCFNTTLTRQEIYDVPALDFVQTFISKIYARTYMQDNVRQNDKFYVMTRRLHYRHFMIFISLHKTI